MVDIFLIFFGQSDRLGDNGTQADAFKVKHFRRGGDTPTISRREGQAGTGTVAGRPLGRYWPLYARGPRPTFRAGACHDPKLAREIPLGWGWRVIGAGHTTGGGQSDSSGGHTRPTSGRMEVGAVAFSVAGGGLAQRNAWRYTGQKIGILLARQVRLSTATHQRPG